MARHRVGSSYLSDEELISHEDSRWARWMFVIGAGLFGYLCHKFLLPVFPYDIAKWLKVTALVVSGIIGGSVFTVIRHYLKKAFSLAILIFILIGIYFALEGVV